MAESNGSVEVCVTVLGPVGIQLSDDVTAELSITTESNTATGKSCFTKIEGPSAKKIKSTFSSIEFKLKIIILLQQSSTDSTSILNHTLYGCKVIEANLRHWLFK